MVIKINLLIKRIEINKINLISYFYNIILDIIKCKIYAKNKKKLE